MARIAAVRLVLDLDLLFFARWAMKDDIALLAAQFTNRRIKGNRKLFSGCPQDLAIVTFAFVLIVTLPSDHSTVGQGLFGVQNQLGIKFL